MSVAVRRKNPVETAAQSLGETKVPKAGTRNALSSSVHIFVAEADDDLRAEIAASLQHEGRYVVECADGPTLFVELEHRVAHPGARRSLVIAQARLPGLSALRILHSLRQLDIQIPMILMTRSQESTLQDLAERAGASAILRKPIQMYQLRRAVAAVIENVPQGSSPSPG